MSNGSNADHLDEVEEGHQALVERLRGLSWPEPPPGVRERGLEQLREVLQRGAARRTQVADETPDG